MNFLLRGIDPALWRLGHEEGELLARCAHCGKEVGVSAGAFYGRDSRFFCRVCVTTTPGRIDDLKRIAGAK